MVLVEDAADVEVDVDVSNDVNVASVANAAYVSVYVQIFLGENCETRSARRVAGAQTKKAMIYHA